MKKLVIGGAAVLATAGIGLGLTQLANADSHSPKPTESSSVSVATGQAGNQQGNSMDGQHGGPGGGMMGLRGIDTATLAQKLGVEESKLNEALQSIQQSQGPGGAPGQGKPSGNGTGQAAEANKKVLDQAVSEGKLTQAEADAVAKAATAGIAEIHGAGSGPR